MSQRALVLGITGGIGGEMSRVLHAKGWEVRALSRSDVKTSDGIEVLRGDAMNPADVVSAARSCDVIVHGVNPPRYEHWEQLALPMLRNTIAAARQSGARIMFPGTIYNFGPNAGSVLRERSPQNAVTRKGAIRVAMEAELERAAVNGVRTTILRAGDFFGPRLGNSWFSQALVKRGKHAREVVYPGSHDVGHSWAFLPDVAEAFVQLIERPDTQPFEVFHFRGHWLPRGVVMAESICRALHLPYSSIKPFPWWQLRALSPFVGLFREIIELKYLWERPVELDNTKLVATLGYEPHTPWTGLCAAP